jgi:hypothetical protein
MILAFWYVLHITCLAEFFVNNMRILLIQRIFPLRQFTVTSNGCRLPANNVYLDLVKEKKNVMSDANKDISTSNTHKGYDHGPHLNKPPAF